MIRLKNITKYYTHQQQHIQALKKINLVVPPGAIMGVIGESGAGKSSLLRCVNLLERPTQGQVWIADQELTSLSIPELRAARRKIGMISQSFNLLSTCTVYQNVALPLRLLKLSKKQIAQQVMPLLALTGLTHKLNTYPEQLSGGQKQRVGIARALVNQPKVLLCDEATSALDPHTTQTILKLLKDLQQQLNLTILLITHEIEVIKAICGEVALLAQGELLEQTDILSFLTQPRSRLAQSFVRTALHQSLPESLQERLYFKKKPNSRSILRLKYYGQSATTLFSQHWMQSFQLKLNILQAHMEPIQGMNVGTVIVEVTDETHSFQQALDNLQQQAVQVEKVGYVD